ncbi:hypothetical protein [Burkholderia ambifaria]|nr:hypothetical protein [Burkholderia ambifaria]
MTQYNTQEEFAQSIRRQVVSTSQAMLDGQLSFLIGSRQLAGLRHEVDAAADDIDFLVFVAIDSETDALPLGAVRQQWDQNALAKLEPEIKEVELWVSAVSNQCMQVIDCTIWSVKTKLRGGPQSASASRTPAGRQPDASRPASATGRYPTAASLGRSSIAYASD